ncbi:MAG TPA: hypothetical protein VK085_11200 [Pseudogracilibacillus sp.]|nr:hypothetical protein [Pseudogracilibacillus sp.]
MITAAQILLAGTIYAIFVGLGTAGTVIARIFRNVWCFYDNSACYQT